MLEVEGDEERIAGMGSDHGGRRLSPLIHYEPDQYEHVARRTADYFVLFAVVLLPILTVRQVPGVGYSVPWSLTILVMVISLLGGLGWLVLLSMATPLWSRIQIDGWGRFENRRSAVQWWTGSIVVGLIVWAIGLVVQVSLGR